VSPARALVRHAGVSASAACGFGGTIREVSGEAGDNRADGGRVTRVVLARDLMREYQQFLHEPSRRDAHSDGRPGRSRKEAHEWADRHDLPWSDDRVHFPDCRVELPPSPRLRRARLWLRARPAPRH
jgi:hypothetical protein